MKQGKKIYFLSDAHLGLPTYSASREREIKLVTWLDSIKQDAEALMRLQETEEDISCLPTLERKDIPGSVPTVQESAADDAIHAAFYNQTTSGIFYLAAAAGCGSGGRKSRRR